LLKEVRKSLTAATDPAETHGVHPADGGTEEADRILALCLLSGEQDALHEVESAIRRILSGTYGICEKTGARIPMQRLRAVPWTRHTKEAQDALEQEAGMHRTGSALRVSPGTGHGRSGTRGTT
jgi:RNA polymerase-binding transcription factor DksA